MEPSVDVPGTPGAARPLRRDAERNRQRIMQAAAEVFTTRGFGATLDDIARQAGVGIGTVYRRFPNKEALVEALFVERIAGIVAAAERACDDPDPWAGLVSFLEHVTAEMAGDLGLRQLLMFATYGRVRAAYARERLRPIVTRLVRRAQQQGRLRPDVRPTDLPFISFMLATAAEYAGEARPEIWRRYLGLITDGLRPARDGTSPLPVPALSPHEMEATIQASAARRQPPRPRTPARGR
ncbi:MAG TPA: TetR/AcrR family transcriptional regulator [Streptosporangiaceae bacterium]|nr:TetR/AcrR family transcriptional regulator [Streptosporangiaceae bacterium]